MGKIRYGVIGSGWRAEFYIRIAKAVPDKFEITAVLIRDKEKGRAFSEKFGVAVVNSLDELMKERPGVCGAGNQTWLCNRLSSAVI